MFNLLLIPLGEIFISQILFSFPKIPLVSFECLSLLVFIFLFKSLSILSAFIVAVVMSLFANSISAIFDSASTD